MKRLFLFACIAFFVISCNNNREKTETKAADNKSSAKYDYAYTLDTPYKDWQIGDQQHVVNVLKSLKAWETGNAAESASYFGDSVDLRFDNLQVKVSHDSLVKMFTMWRNDIASINIKMYDWVPVISADKKAEWVTLWYKQTSTDKAGKTDSLSVVNDFRIVNGKIVELDEKTQHFQVKK